MVTQLHRLCVIYSLTSEGQRAFLKPRPAKVIRSQWKVGWALVARAECLLLSLSRQGIYYGMLGSSRGWRNELMAISQTFSQNVTAEQRFHHRPQNQVPTTCSWPVSSLNSLQGCMTDRWDLDDTPAPLYPRKVGTVIGKQSKHGVCSEHAGQPQRTGVLDSCHVRT